MPITLMVLGFGLVVIGLLFAFGAVGATRAGGNAMKSVSLEGPSWLILVGIGAGVLVFGAWSFQDSNTSPPVVTIDDFDDYDTYEPYDYGDDPWLDGLMDACDQGDEISCDQLYLESPMDSEYEFFGATCGYQRDWSTTPCPGLD